MLGVYEQRCGIYLFFIYFQMIKFLLFLQQTRILVTHGIHWLPMVDKIVVLNDGSIADYGTYEDLISRDGAFAQFLKSYLDQDAESEQEEDVEGKHYKITTEPSHEIMVLFALRKLILQTRMRSHPLGLDV